MRADTTLLWDRYQKYLCVTPELGISLDISRVNFPSKYLTRMSPSISAALSSMADLEAGAISNLDEQRMVGHYWLRCPEIAPNSNISSSIQTSTKDIVRFAERIRKGGRSNRHKPFKRVIHVGIGGSSLGAQFISEALKGTSNLVTVDFLDNADPDSIYDMVGLNDELDQTLVSVVSKSGATPTPKYVERVLKAIYEREGLSFSAHAVATTIAGSELDKTAIAENWLARFPLWDWVGGRTSVTSAVGLVPAAIQGIDISAFLKGAAAMDRITRAREVSVNPAALLALMWFWLGRGRGSKDMVVVPYSDRLRSMARYVQQLVMESVGKRFDRSGALVEQGLTVYGNKGSTDQHAYFQQLKEGPNDFFLIIVNVKKQLFEDAVDIGSGMTLGDYLFASSEGTRNAFYELGRASITITLPDISAKTLGALIALFERAVGLYAELINVNAYNQPGVDKFVADSVIELQNKIAKYLLLSESPQTVEQIAIGIEEVDKTEIIYKILDRLQAIPIRNVFDDNALSIFGRRFWSVQEPQTITND
jgi:glucose-6-phosphate isomerase